VITAPEQPTLPLTANLTKDQLTQAHANAGYGDFVIADARYAGQDAWGYGMYDVIMANPHDAKDKSWGRLHVRWDAKTLMLKADF